MQLSQHFQNISDFKFNQVNGVQIFYLERSIRSVTDRFPMEGGIRRPCGQIRKNNLTHKFWAVVSHWIPAYFIDFALKIIGQKPFMVRIYEKMYTTLDTLSYFMARQWFWTHKNLDNLSQEMTLEDKKVLTHIDIAIQTCTKKW